MDEIDINVVGAEVPFEADMNNMTISRQTIVVEEQALEEVEEGPFWRRNE